MYTFVKITAALITVAAMSSNVLANDFERVIRSEKELADYEDKTNLASRQYTAAAEQYRSMADFEKARQEYNEIKSGKAKSDKTSQSEGQGAQSGIRPPWQRGNSAFDVDSAAESPAVAYLVSVSGRPGSLTAEIFWDGSQGRYNIGDTAIGGTFKVVSISPSSVILDNGHKRISLGSAKVDVKSLL